MYSVCIYSTLLKVVSYYDLSDLSISVMGFQNKKFGLIVSSNQVYFGFLNFAKPLTEDRHRFRKDIMAVTS